MKRQPSKYIYASVLTQEASDSAVQASDDTVLFTALTGGDPSQPLRPRMVAYFQDSPGMANLGCLSVFRPELLERFTRVVEPLRVRAARILAKPERWHANRNA